MKVFIQIVDKRTGLCQHGMIDEPVISGSEITNALKHFGVIYGEVEWYFDTTDEELVNKPRALSGVIKGTTKIVNVVTV